MNYLDFQPHVIRERNEQMQREVASLRLGEHPRSVAIVSGRAIQKEEKEEAKMASIRTMLIRTMLTIVGILAMMVMVSLTAPDPASAKPKQVDVVSSVALCKELTKQIEELEQKEEDGTITADEQGELNSARELYDIQLCAIVDVVGEVLERDVAGADSGDDDCTWKNLWCKLAPVVEVAQTIASPDPGPTNPLPEPLPPLDPRPEPPDPLPPAPVPLGELSKESSDAPDSSGSADVDALAEDDDTPPPKTDREGLEEEGYTCERAGIDSHICTKEGAPDHLCDNGGRCTQIKTTNPNPMWELPKAPTNAGVAKAQPQSLEPAPQPHTEETVASPSAGEVQGEVSSDQYSSAEAIR